MLVMSIIARPLLCQPLTVRKEKERRMGEQDAIPFMRLSRKGAFFLLPPLGEGRDGGQPPLPVEPPLAPTPTLPQQGREQLPLPFCQSRTRDSAALARSAMRSRKSVDMLAW